MNSLHQFYDLTTIWQTSSLDPDSPKFVMWTFLTFRSLPSSLLKSSLTNAIGTCYYYYFFNFDFNSCFQEKFKNSTPRILPRIWILEIKTFNEFVSEWTKKIFKFWIKKALKITGLVAHLYVNAAWQNINVCAGYPIKNNLCWWVDLNEII